MPKWAHVFDFLRIDDRQRSRRSDLDQAQLRTVAVLRYEFRVKADRRGTAEAITQFGQLSVRCNAVVLHADGYFSSGRKQRCRRQDREQDQTTIHHAPVAHVATSSIRSLEEFASCESVMADPSRSGGCMPRAGPSSRIPRIQQSSRRNSLSQPPWAHGSRSGVERLQSRVGSNRGRDDPTEAETQPSRAQVQEPGAGS